jgi:hypothetical protein
MFIDGMSPANLVRAQSHVSSACTLGIDTQLIKANTKDELGGTISETILTLKAFPIRYTPYDRDISQKIGWSIDTDVLAYYSKKTIYDLGYQIENLRRYYKRLRIDKNSFDVTHIEFYSQFSNDFLYIIIGGKR